jgi:hypothetical protein
VLHPEKLCQLDQCDVILIIDCRKDGARIDLDPLCVCRRPCGFARTEPLSRHSRIQRMALAAATPNRSAAALRERPPLTSAITRDRKSSDIGLTMPTGLHIQQAS